MLACMGGHLGDLLEKKNAARALLALHRAHAEGGKLNQRALLEAAGANKNDRTLVPHLRRYGVVAVEEKTRPWGPEYVVVLTPRGVDVARKLAEADARVDAPKPLPDER